MAASSAVLGDYFAKSWSINLRPTYFLLALVGYLGSGVLFIPVLLKEGLVVSSITWSILTILGFIFIGLVMFHESLNMLQVFGVILGIISLVLLNLK